MEICTSKGYISLIGSLLDSFFEEPLISKNDLHKIPNIHKLNKSVRDDSSSAHMTFIHRTELRKFLEQDRHHIELITDYLNEIIQNKEFPIPLGIGFVENMTGAQSYFMACSWPLGAFIRQILGLEPRHFHITIGFNPTDVHDVPKDFSTIIHPRPSHLLLQEAEKYLIRCRNTDLFSNEKIFFLNSVCEICKVILMNKTSNDQIDQMSTTAQAYLSEAEKLIVSFSPPSWVNETQEQEDMKEEEEGSLKEGSISSSFVKPSPSSSSSSSDMVSPLSAEVISSIRTENEETHQIRYVPHQTEISSIKHIYLDLDGVLADFDSGIKALTGSLPDDMKLYDMWNKVRNCKWKKGFFGSLDWQHGGQSLWNSLIPWGLEGKLSILTGLPHGGHSWASNQKKDWCDLKLIKECGGLYKEVICCMSREKMLYARPNTLLIDDRISNCQEWSEAGGFYIHHKSFEETFKQLIELGIVPKAAIMNDFITEECINEVKGQNFVIEKKYHHGKGKGGKGKGKGKGDKGNGVYSGKGNAKGKGNGKGGGRKGDHLNKLISLTNNRNKDDYPVNKKGKFDSNQRSNHTPSSSSLNNNNGNGGGGRYFDAPQTSSKVAERKSCSFFNSPRGCRNGNSCKFAHVS